MSNELNDKERSTDLVYRQPIRVNHFCRYWPIKKTRKNYANGSNHWIERCRCGRTISVDCSFSNGDVKSPQITKVWFDIEGNIVKRTGFGHTNGTNGLDNGYKSNVVG